MNFSYFVLEQFINIIYYITEAIKNIGENIVHKQICFSELIKSINPGISLKTPIINVFSVDGILKNMLSFSLLNLLFSYSLRYIYIKIICLLSPFAILSLSLKNTSWFFKNWLKNLFSLFFIQIIVSLTLIIIFSTNYSDSSFFAKFIYMGGILALIKINSFVREFIGGISTNL